MDTENADFLLEPKLVLNRAKCNRCETVVRSTYRWDFQPCKCGYLAVDGGRAYQRLVVYDVDGAEPYRDFTNMSIWTAPYDRRGLIVQAYQPVDLAIYCVDFRGQQTIANPPYDFVVYEPEGGSTAWTPVDFHANHTLIKESQ